MENGGKRNIEMTVFPEIKRKKLDQPELNFDSAKMKITPDEESNKYTEFGNKSELNFGALFNNTGGLKIFENSGAGFEDLGSGILQESQSNSMEDIKQVKKDEALLRRIEDAQFSAISAKPSESLPEDQYVEIAFDNLPFEWTLKESVTLISNRPIFNHKSEQREIENLFGYYEFPGMLLAKDLKEEQKQELLSEWIFTLTDIYQRFLRKECPYFYVCTKMCCVLFCRKENGTVVGLMNRSMRSMKLVFEKHNIQCTEVMKDLSEFPFPSLEPESSRLSMKSSQEEFQAAYSSQLFDNQFSQKISFIERPNEGIFRFEGKNVHRLQQLILNEWQLGDKDVRILSPSQFLNGAFKIPRIVTHIINKISQKTPTETFVQTTIQGFLLPNHIIPVLKYLSEKQCEVEFNISYSKNTAMFSTILPERPNPISKFKISPKFTKRGVLQFQFDSFDPKQLLDVS